MGLYDITSKETPTMRDLLEIKNPAEYISRIEGIKIISLNEIEENVHNKVFDLILKFWRLVISKS